MIFRNTKLEIAISCRESGKNIWRYFQTYCLIFFSIFFLSEREFFLNAAEPISQQENNPGQALAEQLRSRAPEE
ncbi:MAG: hypothetical protein ACR2H1_04700, partial [Limisphaerales bacterium]